mgnify:FL=1
MVILGEGPLRSHLETKIRDLNLADKVLLPGRVSNVLAYFNLAKVCVVSSRVEGSPNVLLEMMSQNTKVVSTKCAGGIEDIKGLFLANINSEYSLSISIDNALRIDSNENRYLFDKDLDSRSIDKFIYKINSYLNK